MTIVVVGSGCKSTYSNHMFHKEHGHTLKAQDMSQE